MLGKESFGNIWNSDTGNQKNESLIRNALDLQIVPPQLSRTPVTKKGESFIRNAPQLYQNGTAA